MCRTMPPPSIHCALSQSGIGVQQSVAIATKTSPYRRQDHGSRGSQMMAKETNRLAVLAADGCRIRQSRLPNDAASRAPRRTYQRLDLLCENNPQHPCVGCITNANGVRPPLRCDFVAATPRAGRRVAPPDRGQILLVGGTPVLSFANCNMGPSVR